MALPVFARQFIYGAVEGAVVSIVALNILIPGSLSDVKALALTLLLTLVRAVAASATLGVPAFLAWFRAKLGLTA